MPIRFRERITFAGWGFFVILALELSGCTGSTPPSAPPGYPKPYKALGKWYQPLPDSQGFRQRGIASWYGKDFHGRKTSNGEVYDMYAMTAAHKTLPLGTYVRVHHVENHRKVDVRINDRGPFVRGRIIDLSYVAANRLGIVGPGTAEVEIVALGTLTSGSGGSQKTYTPVDYNTGNFTLQVGAFKDRRNAERKRAELDQKYKYAHITIYNNGYETFYRVRVGKASTLQEAIEYKEYLSRNGEEDVFVVAE